MIVASALRMAFATIIVVSSMAWLAPTSLSQESDANRLATAEARIDALERSLAELEGRVAVLEGGTPTPAVTQQNALAPTAPPVAVGSSSRDQPIPMGEAGRVGDWTIVVTLVNPSAEAAMLAENSFNSPPAPGTQFFMIGVSATYNGTESAQPSLSLTFKAVGDSNVAYNTFSPGCGVVPASLSMVDEVFGGGTVEGNVCFPIAQNDAGSLVMYVEPLFSVGDERTWFSLDDGGEALDG